VLALACGKFTVSVAMGDAKGQMVPTADDGAFVAVLCETRCKGEAVQTLAFAKTSPKVPKCRSVDVKSLSPGVCRMPAAPYRA